MMPPPRTTSRRGTSVWASRPVESTHRGESSPGIGGRIGDEPVATIALLNVTSSAPSTAIVFGPVKRPLPLHPLDAVRLEERGDAARHLLDDAVLPRGRGREVERRLADVRRRASRTSRARRGARARSAPTPSSGCSRRAGRCRRAPAPARCTRPCRRAARRGSRPCSRPGPPPRTATSHSIRLTSFPSMSSATAIVASRRSRLEPRSIVSESSSRSTRSKPCARRARSRRRLRGRR